MDDPAIRRLLTITGVNLTVAAGLEQYYNEERPHGAIGQKTPVTLLNRDGAASPPS